MKDKFNRAAIAALFVLGILTLIAALSGCGSVSPIKPLKPDEYRVEVEHVSHPFAGWPFGAADEEDALTQANFVAVKRFGNMSIEQGLGYKINEASLGGGFKGPRLTYTGRISYTFGAKD